MTLLDWGGAGADGMVETDTLGRSNRASPTGQVLVVLCVAFVRHARQLLYLGALAAATSAACVLARLSFSGIWDVARIAIPTFAVGLLWQAAAMLTSSAPIGQSKALMMLGRLGDGFATFAVWMGVTACAGMLSYLSARLPVALLDARLAAADAVLGFHWPLWAAAVTAIPTLPRLLHAIYFSLIPQFLLIFLIAAVCTDRRRLAELFWSVSIAATLTCSLSGLIPALGAKPYFGVAGADWVHDLTRLREPGQLVFKLQQMTGIVSLPSFHTELAVIFAWAARRTGLLGWAVAVLNAVMIVSTLTVGGHYLVDVVAGGRVRRRLHPGRAPGCLRV